MHEYLIDRLLELAKTQIDSDPDLKHKEAFTSLVENFKPLVKRLILCGTCTQDYVDILRGWKTEMFTIEAALALIQAGAEKDKVKLALRLVLDNFNEK